MHKTINTIGILAMLFGLIASLFAFIQWYWPLVAVISGFLGFIFSSVYVFMNARHHVNDKTLNPGMIGMLLSSVPVIFFFFLVMSK